LEKTHEKEGKVTYKKLNEFACEIFKEREAEQQIPLLEKYHKMMVKKYRDAKHILLNERRNLYNRKNRKKKV
jgi:hypothetical protein